MKPNNYNVNNHSGRFNKRVSIWGPTITQDKIGNEIETFGEICEVWAMVKTMKGSEYAVAAQTNTVNVTRFVMRYSKPLDDLFAEHGTGIELRYKGAKYDVKSIINDDELNQTFTLIAEGRE